MQKAWWKEAVVYQIYPRSFMDSNGDGIGDLNGITSRLDYLKDLGVDVLWLSPVYKSPNYDNGYDISDYRAIMAEFGTMADFDRLLAEAHNYGLKIVMDLVVNHTSSEHPWFVESRKSRDNPYRDYYIWRDGKGDQPPNNWGSWFGGSTWEYDDATQQYYLHCFAKQQPDLNWANDAVRRDVFSLMTWWCDKGIDGFRMDVISMISKDPRFPDGVKKGGLYGDLVPHVCHGPRVHEYLQEMRRTVIAKYDLMTVGEAARVTVAEAKKYAAQDGSELDMVFQFEHVEAGSGAFGQWTTQKVDMRVIRSIISKWQMELAGAAWNSVYWSNHDQPRSVSRFGNDSDAFRIVSAKMLATIEFTLQGTPYIYQGEELGMTNAAFTSLADYRDVDSINAYHELTDAGFITPEEMLRCLAARSRDNARTPMQWDGGANAGFTTGVPWIHINPNYPVINAASARADTNSIYHYYRQLIALRKTHAVAVYGNYTLLLPQSDNIWAYTRTLNGETLLCIANLSCDTVQYPLSLNEALTKGALLIGNYAGHEVGTLHPYECAVYLQNA
jgi:oligo-1,6-glucosidase